MKKDVQNIRIKDREDLIITIAQNGPYGSKEETEEDLARIAEFHHKMYVEGVVYTNGLPFPRHIVQPSNIDYTMLKHFITPDRPVQKTEYNLLTSKAYIYLDYVTATGLDSIDELNKLKVTVQPTHPSGKQLDPIQVEIKIDPNQKQPVFEIKKKFKGIEMVKIHYLG